MAGVGESLKQAGGLGNAILILAFLGNICNWISFTTATWARQFSNGVGVNDFYTGFGLWRACDGGGQDTLPVACFVLDGSLVFQHGAIQALMSIGFFGVNIMFIIIFVKTFSGMFSDVYDINKVTGILALVTAAAYFTGIVVFAVEYGSGVKLRNISGRDGDLGFSFMLAVFANLFQVVLGIILLVMGLKR